MAATMSQQSTRPKSAGDDADDDEDDDDGEEDIWLNRINRFNTFWNLSPTAKPQHHQAQQQLTQARQQLQQIQQQHVQSATADQSGVPWTVAETTWICG